MQQISLIGRVLKLPKEFTSNGIKCYFYVLRAENSPSGKSGSSFDFNVISTNQSMRASLTVGTHVYVNGLLSIECLPVRDNSRIRAVVQAVTQYIIDGNRPDTTGLTLEMVAGSIPLDF